MESAPPRAFEIFYERAFKAMGIPVIPMHGAVVTGQMEGRNTCLFATPCGRGCAIGANFQSTTVLLPPAMATGNLTIRTDALVYQVDLDKAGKAKGVTFVDRKTGAHHSVTAKSVVLAAGSGETARILLNSKSAAFPNGLCNTHGMVGRYLMDSVGTGVTGQFPALEGLPPTNDDGQGTQHTYIPWWGYEKQKELGFARGYHIEIGGGRRMPSMGMAGLVRDDQGLVGDALRAKLRERFGSTIGFDGRGEMIPNDDCYCEIDPVAKDKWGIPVLRFHWKWGESEILQAKHMQETFRTIIQQMGGEALGNMPGRDEEYGIAAGGRIIHEAGATRMGADPKTSVLNEWCQAHEAKNVVVCDAGPFVSNADKNCTWTIMALAWRTASHLADEMQKGNI
jgi:choline dehydrogenase-like flavoprotein